MGASNDETLSAGHWLPGVGSMILCPSAALGSLKERPRWLYPLLLAASCSVSVNLYVIYRIGFTRLVNAALQASAALDPKTVSERALAHRGEILFFQGLATFAGTFLIVWVVSRVLWLILQVIGEELAYKIVLAVVAHVTMLVSVIRGAMLALTASVMPDLENLDLRNPLATNLAFFLHSTSPVAIRLFAALDLATFGEILLLALGLSRVSTLSFRKACILVMVPWGVYTGVSLFLPG